VLNKLLIFQGKAIQPEVHLLIDAEKDEKQISILVEFLRRIEAPIPAIVLSKAKVSQINPLFI